jgi:hypothetical protein
MKPWFRSLDLRDLQCSVMCSEKWDDRYDLLYEDSQSHHTE